MSRMDDQSIFGVDLGEVRLLRSQLADEYLRECTGSRSKVGGFGLHSARENRVPPGIPQQQRAPSPAPSSNVDRFSAITIKY